MELQRLAAKQKRYHDIKIFAEHDVKEPLVRTHLLETLQNYKRALAQCWNKQAISAEDALLINSLERTLESLHNEARLLAHPL
jgi:hypothetical protein